MSKIVVYFLSRVILGLSIFFCFLVSFSACVLVNTCSGIISNVRTVWNSETSQHSPKALFKLSKNIRNVLKHKLFQLWVIYSPIVFIFNFQKMQIIIKDIYPPSNFWNSEHPRYRKSQRYLYFLVFFDLAIDHSLWQLFRNGQNWI